MSAVRLSTSDKSDIILQLLIHKYQTPFMDFLRKSMKFTDEVYLSVYGDELESLKSISEDWFVKSSSFKVKFGDSYTSLDFTGRWGRWHRTSSIRSFTESVIDSSGIKFQARIIKPSSNPVVFPLDHKFSEKYRELRDECNALTEQIEQAKSSAWSAIYKIPTLKRLLETWPELKPFTGFLDDRKIKNLPVIGNVDELNKKFDLPVDEDETV